MPSTSELSPIAAPSGAATQSGDPVRVGIQPLELLRRHARLAAAVACSVGLLGALSLKSRMKPSYETSAIVYVSPIFPTALGDSHDHDRQYDSFIEQQVTAATRYETLQKAVRKFPQAWPTLFPGETEQNQILRLQKALKVEQVGHSYEISISLESDRPATLADFVNEVTAQYLADARSEEVYGHDQKLATLKQDKADIEKQLAAAMQKQNQLMQDVGMAHYDASGGANPFDDTLLKLREQYSEAHEKAIEADAEYRSLGQGNTPSPGLQQAAQEEVNLDGSVSATKAALTAKKATNLSLMTGLKPSNPTYLQMQADNAEIDQRLDQINRDALRKASAHIQQRDLAAKARATSLENQLSSDIAKTTALATNARPRLQQSQLVASEVDRLLAMEGTVETRLQNVSLETDSPGSVRLFSAALPPGGPVKRKTAIAYGALLVGCFIAGFAAAFIADAIDPHIYTSRDIRKVVGFPPIGLLLSDTEFSPDMQREYFLRLAGGLDQAHRRTGARTFVFPSVARSDSNAIVERLGAELANNGLRVLVVNILHPGETKPAAKTSTSAATSLETQQSNPRLLTVTDSAQLSSEIDKEPFRVISLPAAEISELLRRSRSYYNAILVAADPLFTSAYTEHFARTADGTILIVDSGKTRKDELVRAARLLERLKIAGIAIVLNGITEKRAEDDVAKTIADYRRSAA
jgi:succinoglycan biosynthesis transport protein ExoP